MAEAEEEEGMTLPDELWSAMEQLQTTSECSLVQRLAIEHQVAHTAYSSVFSAVLDGGSKVIVKVSARMPSYCGQLHLRYGTSDRELCKAFAGWTDCKSRCCAHVRLSVVWLFALAQRMDVGSSSDEVFNEQLGNVFAEVSVLKHLSNWPGCVEVVDFARSNDQVRMRRCKLHTMDYELWCR